MCKFYILSDVGTIRKTMQGFSKTKLCFKLKQLIFCVSWHYDFGILMLHKIRIFLTTLRLLECLWQCRSWAWRHCKRLWCGTSALEGCLCCLDLFFALQWASWVWDCEWILWTGCGCSRVGYNSRQSPGRRRYWPTCCCFAWENEDFFQRKEFSCRPLQMYFSGWDARPMMAAQNGWVLLALASSLNQELKNDTSN